MKKSEFAISALGLATPIGCGKGAVASQLFHGTRQGLIPLAEWIPHHQVMVGAITTPLPPLPMAMPQFASRNNQMLWMALAEIQPELTAAIKRFGRHRVAVVLGTSTSGKAEGEEAMAQKHRGNDWPAGFDLRVQEAGNLAECAATLLGVTGPVYTVTTACSSSAKVFLAARRLLRHGLADAAVVGGVDSLNRTTLNGFFALEALSRGYCHPFSANRDGINIGEAAAIMLMVPEEGSVLFLGGGESSDAHHISAPHPQGDGALASMQQALADAKLEAGEIAYINLHGTATQLNDHMEGLAVHALFGERTPCSSTKAMTGHTLGASGAVEAAFLWLTLHPDYNPGTLPPHLWDGVADPLIPPLNLVAPNTPMARGEPLAMLSNSFAFGGSNATLIFGREG